MTRQTVPQAEWDLLEKETPWAQERQLVRVAAGRKLFRLLGTDGSEWYVTLISGSSPRLVFHEPVHFVVTVHQARGACRAGHQVGDRWTFDWCTPAGLCGSAYHALYPVLHGLMLTGGRYVGPAAKETFVSCPDQGWLTFRLARHRWTPEMWEGNDEGPSHEPGAPDGTPG
jgi:uncharacterized repeat protein (TIGR04076 family)